MGSENRGRCDDFLLRKCSSTSLVRDSKDEIRETMASAKRRRYSNFLLQKCPITSAINDGGKFLAQALYFFNKVQKISPQNHMRLLKSFWNYSSGLIDKSELQTAMISVIGDNPQLTSDFSVFMKSADEIVTGLSKDKTGIENRVAGKRSRRDRRKPKSHEGLKTGRYSVPSREDHRSRKEEETMERWKDAMYEADMCTIWFKSAASFAEKVSAGTEERGIQGMSRNHFFRCLEQLYGDYNDQILEIWHKNPVTASALVLTRLRQKLVDLTNFREQLKSQVQGSLAWHGKEATLV